jgi:hypothetical protein
LRALPDDATVVACFSLPSSSELPHRVELLSARRVPALAGMLLGRRAAADIMH